MSLPLNKLRDKAADLARILRASPDARTQIAVLLDMVTKRARALRLHQAVRKRHGPAVPSARPGDVVVVCVLRDAMEHLPTFLRHHRELGIRHFVFLDNGSEDETVDYLSAQSDTTVYQCGLPFRTYKHLFKRHLVRLVGRNRWILLLDVDECLDFPESSRASLPQFCHYLDAHGHTAVVAHMLDMFAEGPVLSQRPLPRESDLREHFRHYDISGIRGTDYRQAFGSTNRLATPDIRCLSCGVNLQVFGNDTLLTKHPLFKWTPPLELPKFSHDIRYANIADVSAVLRHYKFTPGLTGVIERALREGGYHGNSRRYRNFARTLANNPGLSLHGPTTRRLGDVNELVACGFLQSSRIWREWVNARHRSTTDE